ncbi:HEPN domain-containing protein [Ohtaekwangia koreensis]|uniref:Sulfite reductase (Ferredoxin) n=1 Tax=Ohtaekwangia koreensis TaxID=688867 RepID=A0A1T5MEE6_9BACT|nr:HEPN domain-containing protein [Ohtaekwangia koreensis]SKC86590.1 sulfite reductase (ferredoxin) [Ohtaekwangia koreensis]
MQSFRTELEDLNNPVVAQDILDLEKKIRLFREGKIDSDKFRSLRLARGIYGQRQSGVQMIRIKLPLGRVTTKQLRRIADISDEYASKNLHATTRQDIQIHFVSLDRTPELWAKLEKDDITTREACGNTVRNITASDLAGIDPNEPFDVSPYAQEMFRYFLRNPVCQEMGRKFKISFSSSDDDTAFSFIHDLGFIPKIVDGKRGFKVMIGGGLGANPTLALTAYEFLEEDQIIPFTEAVLRVFDRYGERTRRMKARFKFLLDDLGLEKIMALVEEEKQAVKVQQYTIDLHTLPEPVLPEAIPTAEAVITNPDKYDRWYRTNVIKQKQDGFFGVYVKLPLGNMSSNLAREFADIVDTYAATELRITVNQGYLIRFVRPEALKHLYVALDKLALAEPGFDSVADITACPGTESCNLAISDSTQISLALEKVIREEYPEMVFNTDIKIKISGCPNSCGQHGLAGIGLHGSTIKDKQGKVLPALVVLLGGGKLKNGEGIISDKILKIPSKRGPQALRILFDDYEANSLEGEYYHDYFKRIGRNHFYTILKPLGDLTSVVPTDYIDWGEEHNFILHTAVGECAGVIIDLVATLFYESEEKLEWAKEALRDAHYADAIYQSYSAFINTAKALLLTRDVKPSTQIQVLLDFQQHFVETGLFQMPVNFREHVLRINKNEPTEEFAIAYLEDSKKFLEDVMAYRAIGNEVVAK